jgi:hypothetical protein
VNAEGPPPRDYIVEALKWLLEADMTPTARANALAAFERRHRPTQAERAAAATR